MIDYPLLRFPLPRQRPVELRVERTGSVPDNQGCRLELWSLLIVKVTWPLILGGTKHGQEKDISKARVLLRRYSVEETLENIARVVKAIARSAA
jgi:hypothetical protein